MLTINFTLRIGSGCSGCGGCNIVCCGPHPACKAPRNTNTEAMHWLDKKHVVHSVKKGELIPHYSKIVQVYTNSKWEVFTPASDMKAAQDACSCVPAVRFYFPSFIPPRRLHQFSIFTFYPSVRSIRPVFVFPSEHYIPSMSPLLMVHDSRNMEGIPVRTGSRATQPSLGDFSLLGGKTRMSRNRSRNTSKRVPVASVDGP